MSIILSIDPSTTNIGLAISEVDIDNNFTPLIAFTVDLTSMAMVKYGQTLVQSHGMFYARIRCIGDVIGKLLRTYNPDYVSIESSYMGKFAAAFEALVQCITSIKQALYDYSPTLTFTSITPSEIKTHVGVKGNSGDKNLMTEGVRPLLVNSDVNIDHIDEHAIDAIAGGYAFYSIYVK